MYRDFLVQENQKAVTISAKLTAIRKFYHLAQKFHIISENPAEDVKAPRDPDAALVNIPYLTAGKLEYLFHSIPSDTERSCAIRLLLPLWQ